MKKIYRILTFLLCVLCFAAFFGCAPDNGGNETETQPGDQTGDQTQEPEQYVRLTKGTPLGVYAGNAASSAARYGYAATLYDNGVFYLQLGFVLTTAPAPPVFVVVDGTYEISGEAVTFTYKPILDERGVRDENTVTVNATIDADKTVISNFKPNINATQIAGSAATLYKLTDKSEGAARIGDEAEYAYSASPFDSASSVRYALRVTLWKEDSAFTLDFAKYAPDTDTVYGTIEGTYTEADDVITFTYQAAGAQRTTVADIQPNGGQLILGFSPYLDESEQIPVAANLYLIGVL
jgi:hypothetical protein